MINFEEELKKFHPSMDVNEAEDAIYSRDLTDVTDILREMLNDEKENGKIGRCANLRTIAQKWQNVSPSVYPRLPD